MKKFFYSVLAVAFAALTFTSCDDVPMPYSTPEVNNGGSTYDNAEGDGTTAATAYNVAGVLQYISTLEAGVESENDVYIKGTVASIEQAYSSTSYGTGTFDITDGKNTFTVYRAKYLSNKTFSSSDTDIKIGDEVIICGKVYNFKGNKPETVSGKAYIYSLNGVGGSTDPTPSADATGDGTQANPYNVAAAIAKCKEIGTELSADKYYVKGIVAEDATVNATYGNITFDMVDVEGGDAFKAYQVAGPDGAKLASDFKVSKGDVVVVYGKMYNYQGNTPETDKQGKAYIITVNDKAPGASTGGDDNNNNNSSTDANMSKSVDADKYTVTFTNTNATAGESVTYDLTTCEGVAHQAENPSFTLNGVTFAFEANGGKTTPKYWKTGNFNEFRLYALNTLTITCTANIQAVTFQCAEDYQGTKYTGNDDAFAVVNGKVFTFTNQFSANSGGVQCRIKSVTITYAK